MLGIAFDGLGLGDDGTIWGGELLRCSPASSTRVGRLRPVRQPGGDAATRHPWRMAMAYAEAAGVLDEVEQRLRPSGGHGLGRPRPAPLGSRLPLDQLGRPPVRRRRRAARRLPRGVLRRTARDAPRAVRRIAREPPTTACPSRSWTGWWRSTPTRCSRRWSTIATATAPSVAGRFHDALAEATARACAIVREGTGLDRAVLGGGVFHNDRFTSELVGRLTGTGFRVFLPREVPVGDGGIALGQVLVANAWREAV